MSKAPGLAVLIAKRAGPPKDQPAGGEKEEVGEHDMAADEAFDAIKNDDREGFREAIKSLCDMYR